MKKLILLSLLTLSLIATLNIKPVNAEITPFITVNSYSDLWTYVYDTTEWEMQVVMPYDATAQDYRLLIPIFGTADATSGDTYTTGLTYTWGVMDVEVFISYENFRQMIYSVVGDTSIFDDLKSLETAGSDPILITKYYIDIGIEILELTDVSSVTLHVAQDTPYSFALAEATELIFQTEISIYQTQYQMYINFYHGTEIVESDWYPIGSEITTPEYDLGDAVMFSQLGWLSETQHFYTGLDITIELSHVWSKISNQDFELNLYSRFNMSIPDYVEPVITPDAPSELSTLFAEFGLDNVSGYLIVLIFSFVAIFILFATLHLPMIIYFVGSLGLTLLWLFVGFLPLYIAGIIIIILAIMYFSLQNFVGGET